MFSEVFITEEVNVVGEKGSRDTTTVDVQTVLEAFYSKSIDLPVSLINLFFSGKKQNLWSWDHPPQVLNYQDF